MSLSVLPLGVGDAFSGVHYSFSLLVSHVDESGRTCRLLIDCPHPLRKMLREASTKAGLELDVADIDAVVLTHLHGDHASGLESFGYFNTFALGKKATLLTHPAVSARLWEGHLAAGMERLLTLDEQGGPCFVDRGLDDAFSLLALDENAPVSFGPFSIECRRTIHHIPTTALRIEAGGRTLGISADTAFDPSLIAWLDAADLIVHETNFGPAHTPYGELADLPEALRAKMRLIHYPDGFESDAIGLLEEGVVIQV